MITVDQLRTMRDTLREEYEKDLAAIDRLISRLGGDDALPLSLVRVSEPSSQKRKVFVRPDSLRGYIKRCFDSAGHEAELTAPMIHDTAKEFGAALNGNRERAIASLGTVLNGMVNDGLVEKVRQGIGRSPSAYRWSKDLKSQEPAEAGS